MHTLPSFVHVGSVATSQASGGPVAVAKLLNESSAKMTDLVADIDAGLKMITSAKNLKPPKPWATSWDKAPSAKTEK
eukprot:2017127-Pyramimonas_sp.AAC.1